MLGGIGASVVIKKLNKKKVLIGIFGVIVFIGLVTPIAESYSNENVYFNFLVGGLSGAKAADIPSWGNSFGAAYRQAAVWIDQNVPKNGNITFIYELIPNLPRIWIRQDINLNALNRSGYLKKGEYAFTLNYEGTDNRSYYDMYLNTFLNAVYQAKVDGVPVVSVWKNDEAHLKTPWIEQQVPNVITNKREIGLQFDLNGEYKISRLDMTYNSKNCTDLATGYFEISSDNITWKRLPGVLPDDWTITGIGAQPKDGKFIEPFVGQKVRYINFNVTPANTCLIKNYISVKFFYLK